MAVLTLPQRTLMGVDVVFPGWMPWRRLAVAQDVPAYFEQVKMTNRRRLWAAAAHRRHDALGLAFGARITSDRVPLHR